MRFVDSGSTRYKGSGGSIKSVKVRIGLMLPSVCKNGKVGQDPGLARTLGDRL
jgi:hypothetical protein